MASTSPPLLPRAKGELNQVTIISHSNLYYWWPVWVVGFVMAIITYFEGYVMAVLPAKDVAAAVDADVTIATHSQNDKGEKSSKDTHNDQVVVYAPQTGDPRHYGQPINDNKEAEAPYLRVSPSKTLGVVFTFVLLMVIFITNVPLRGMWSVLVIVVAVSLVVFFILLGWIEIILHALYLLDVRINMAGYVTISLFLLIIWLVSLLVFDKQRYITFTPGQFKVCDEVGGGEQVYSTDGMTLQKQRSDFFRHVILGLGSGDLIVRTAGAQVHHIDLPNVLFIGAKVRQIEQLLKTKTVIESH
ncbi:MAG TPA: hypothetical protein DDY78_16165 [Planctomycetales bacterium]|jgi:hypothetical protein|nr:hypothetical protein [Planctomycetales bacterium]